VFSRRSGEGRIEQAGPLLTYERDRPVLAALSAAHGDVDAGGQPAAGGAG
jgi:hypothetical protein